MNTQRLFCGSILLTLLSMLFMSPAPGRAQDEPLPHSPQADAEWLDNIRQNHQQIAERLEFTYNSAENTAMLSNDDLYTLAVCRYYGGDYNGSLQICVVLRTFSEYAQKAFYLTALNYFQLYHDIEDWNIKMLLAIRECLLLNTDDPRTWMAIQSIFMTAPRSSGNTITQSFVRQLRQDCRGRFGENLIWGHLQQIRFQYDAAETAYMEAWRMAKKNPATLQALIWHYRQRGMLEQSLPPLRSMVLLQWDERFAEELQRDEAALERLKKLKSGELQLAPVPASSGKPVYQFPWPAGEARYLADPSQYSPAAKNLAHEGRGQHAYDFIMPAGSAICAMRSGTVIEIEQVGETDKGSKELVNFVAIRHDDGTIARYFNIANVSCEFKLGESVHAGDVIAIVSRTYTTLSSHLHVDVVQKAPRKTGLPYYYRNCETIPFEFAEWNTMNIPREDRLNAWHISLNSGRK
ncbi:M23 family metallopeptidase [Candidatus Sumerlaeota bacterium]|nr:M23 family metallopeptidase [Candidatus Sumerlaeota bacterium]